MRRVFTDNGSVPVPTVAELSNLPSSVTTAYVQATQKLYVKTANGWKAVLTEA